MVAGVQEEGIVMYYEICILYCDGLDCTYCDGQGNDVFVELEDSCVVFFLLLYLKK